MLETAASVGWKVKDAIVWFHGIGRLVAVWSKLLTSLARLKLPQLPSRGALQRVRLARRRRLIVRQGICGGW
jgi:hypothetical protein